MKRNRITYSMSADEILNIIDHVTAPLDLEEYGSVLAELLDGIKMRIDANRETTQRRAKEG